MADADLQRIVETKFMLRDELSSKLGIMTEQIKKLHEHEKKAQEETRNLGEKMTQLGERVEGVKERLFGMAAGFGVILGGSELAKKFVEANAEAETLVRTMGAMVSANYQYGKMNPADNFVRSMATARAMKDEFEDAGMKFGLNADALGDAASMMMPAFAKAKIGTKEASEEIVKLGRLSQITGRDLSTTSQALDMFLMSGMASKRNPLFALLGITAMPEGKFTAEQRFESLQKALVRFNIDSMKGVVTFNDRVQMLKVRLDNLYEEGGKPFFDAANVAAEKLAIWMDKNKESIVKAANVVAEKFSRGLEIAGTLLKTAADHATLIKDAFFAIVASSKITGFFEKVNGTLAKFGELPKATESLSKVGGAIGMAATASMVAQAGLIGVAIGTAIGDWMDSKGFFTPKKGLEEQARDLDVARVKGLDDFRSKALREEIQNRKDLMGAKTDRDAVNILIKQLEGGGKVGLGRYDGKTVDASAAFVMQWAKQQGIIASPEIKPPVVDTEKAKTQPRDINFNNAKFDITQQFSPGFDPDRIAVALQNGIAKAGERRLMSNLGPGMVGAFGIR